MVWSSTCETFQANDFNIIINTLSSCMDAVRTKAREEGQDLCTVPVIN